MITNKIFDLNEVVKEAKKIKLSDNPKHSEIAQAILKVFNNCEVYFNNYNDDFYYYTIEYDFIRQADLRQQNTLSRDSALRAAYACFTTMMNNFNYSDWQSVYELLKLESLLIEEN